MARSIQAWEWDADMVHLRAAVALEAEMCQRFADFWRPVMTPLHGKRMAQLPADVLP